MDDIAGPALTDRHLQSIQHQLCAQVVCHRPANNLAAPGIKDDGC
jgi:hypothetical protein